MPALLQKLKKHDGIDFRRGLLTTDINKKKVNNLKKNNDNEKSK